jgi:hypothetical protein
VAKSSTLLALLPAALLAVLPAPAFADIYRCTDGEGLVTFTDSPSRKFKECTLLYRDTTPPPAPRAAPGGAAGTPAQGAPRARSDAPAASTRGNPGPENFPRIDRGEQRERDLKARQIVERELSNEQRALDEARRQVAALGTTANDRSDPRLREWQNAVSRHERNIAEIQRQLAVMK